MVQPLGKMIRNGIRIGGYLYVIAAITFHILNILFPMRVDISYSTMVYAGDQKTVIHTFLSEDDKWRFYITPEEVPSLLKQLLVFKEDQYFFQHPGINPMAIMRALYFNIIQQRRTSGASTISMQVVRLLHPLPRTLGSKIKESFRALQLELSYSKKEILNLYCHMLPYGGNIEGLEAATRIYFGKEAMALSVSEQVLLCIIPNKPTSLRLREGNDQLKQHRDIWIKRFWANHIIKEEEALTSLNEPLMIKRHPLPRIAPHLCRRAFLKGGHTPIKGRIYTSLHDEIQRYAENALKAYVKRLETLDIHNGTAVIIDNHTGTYLAYCGSQDFNDEMYAGQVDGIMGIRSPGSTLKPLLYGMAMDEGLYTPQTILYDVPMDYDGYRPRNFTREFKGVVTLEESLLASLNIPAVQCLHALGSDKVNQKLISIGFHHLLPGGELPGLALALGGCGAHMEQLASLYTALAYKGVWRPLSFVSPSFLTSPKMTEQMLSPQASFLVTDILKKSQRPDFPFQSLHKVNKSPIAWKSGTSFGRKDAWSLGYNQRYTVGVWIGNFDGKGVPELEGSSIASPLLFDFFFFLENLPESINNNSKSPIPQAPRVERPDGVAIRKVCYHSGSPPGHLCDDIKTDYYIVGVSHTNTCQHLMEIWTSPDQRISYCNSCKNEQKQAIKGVYHRYPLELISYWRQENIYIPHPPPHFSGCSVISDSDEGPLITSLSNGGVYLLDHQDRRGLQLLCVTQQDVEKAYWYAGDRLIGISKNGEAMYWNPPEGLSLLSVIDEKGRKRTIEIRVEHY
jgi:penicillin-binding protein 1C